MAITQEFNLNMIPDSAPVVVHVNQYDEGEGRLVIHLLDGMVPYVPSTGAEAIIQGTKPDGKGFDYNATLSGSTVTADVTKQMTAVAGVVRVQVVITEGDDVTGTFVFDLAVQKSGLPADTDMSESEYQVVMQLIETAEGINNNPPKIGTNGHWWVWDANAGAYVDSGVDASVSVDIADITMLLPDATPYVTNTGTDTDPIFHLFIPRGQTGIGISSISKTGTSGYVDTYTVTYTDGSTSQFEITNGRNTDQVTAIPTASAELVGTIYQYIGESTSSYTHGFYYECVNDGGVYKWVNIPVGNDPVAITSTDPYTYHQGKGNLADMEIVGASVGWNQLVQNGNFASTSGWNTQNGSLSVSNNNALVTCTTDNKRVILEQTIRPILNHKYLVSCKIKFSENSSTKKYNIGFYDNFNASTNASTSEQKFQFVFQANFNDVSYGKVWFSVTNAALNDTLTVSECNVFDLTLLFGSTIADAIYAMEQATAGAGVAFFRKYFPKDYYAYDVGSIQSVCVGSRKVAPKNYFNREDVINAYLNIDTGTITSSNANSYSVFCYLPKGGIYTVQKAPSSVFRYALYNNKPVPYRQCISGSFVIESPSVTKSSFMVDHECWFAMFCVNTSSSGDVARKEEIFDSVRVVSGLSTENEYSFDSTKELRGLFSLEGGELKANGDVYTADGNIQRKYGIVDLGTLTWSIYDNKFQSPTSNIGAKSAVGICSKKYIFAGLNASYITQDKQFSIGPNYINFRDDSYTDAAAFTTAMSGVYLVYELATPTTETAQPYQNPQRAYLDGTEEFTDGLTRDVMIPVGNNSVYQQDKILPSIEDYVDSITDTKTDISAIAPEENGATASKAYSVGQHFYKDGKFCTAIASIAINSSFTLNTNYVEGTIAEAIEGLVSKSTTNGLLRNDGSVDTSSYLKKAVLDIDPSAATISAYEVGTMYIVTQ